MQILWTIAVKKDRCVSLREWSVSLEEIYYLEVT